MNEKIRQFIVEGNIKGENKKEKYSDAVRVFRLALDRMNEDPDFTFTCSSAVYYEWIEKADREMFAEIAERIREDRWFLTGGWWMKPVDEKISGEMYARQFLYGQIYYYKTFGRICRTGVCGCEPVLPQLLYKAGMYSAISFCQEEPVRQKPFWWDGVDGTRVVAYPRSEAMDGEMLFTDIRDSRLDSVKACTPDIQYSSTDIYFKELLSQNIRLVRWTGKLRDEAVFESGKTEDLLESAEKWNLLASKAAAAEPACEEMEKAWKAFFQAGHEDEIGEVQSIASGLETAAQISIANSIDTLTGRDESGRCVAVFNGNAQAVEAPVRISGLSKRVCDCDGREVAFYNTEKETVFFAQVPAVGYAVYYLTEADEEASGVQEKETEQYSLRAVETGFHKGGGAPKKKSFLTIDSDHVAVKAMKYSEDGSGDVILRCYETAGQAIDHVMAVCERLDCGFWFDIGNYEVKTFRIAKDGHVTEVNLLEGIIR